MADILHLIKIRAPRERLYQALATAEGVRAWWTRDADLDTKVGGAGEFRFAGGKRITKVRIEELKPSARVVWKVLSAPMPTWAETTISFDLSTDDDGTLLHFAHRGIKQADELFAISTTAWGYFLVSLKQYLETGKGTPHPEDIFSRKTNA
ncbi:MAG: SRPBCC family protein [Gammaproteobacteria bacterium]